MPKGVRGGSIKDRAKMLKEKIKERPGMQKAKSVIEKVKKARAKGEEASSAKGGRHRKAASKLMLKSGGSSRRYNKAC